jgi:tol-pal system protein YbgF
MGLKAFVSATAGAWVLAAVFGCARTAEERQLDQLRDEIDRIQEARDRTDRAALASEPAEPGPSAAAGRPSPAPAKQVGPDVVRVGTSSTESVADDSADPEDTAPRPSIRVLGTPRSSARNGWRGQEFVEQTHPDDGAGPSAAPPRPSALDPEAKHAYDGALSLVNARQYEKALDALAAFLVKWPDHPYADNAMYWRGECYFARGEYARASEQFDGVLARFPLGNKAPDALLKLGICQQRLGDPAKARETFQRLAQLYPQSEAARRVPSVTAPASEDRR